MSRYFNSFMDNSSEALEHSWGTSPKAKAREKEYNHWYYQKHKDKLSAIRKQRHEATNKYKQAEKSHDDALRYKFLADKMDARLNKRKFYESLAKESEKKSRELIYQGNRLKAWAKADGNRIRHDIKNPTVKDLVEFYLDTTVEKAKNSANKAKKYATKAISSAEKAAKKYATEAMSSAEKAANKAKKYATKTVKSVANKAKKYVVR